MKSDMINPRCPHYSGLRLHAGIALVCATFACADRQGSGPAADPIPDEVDFNFHVKPILADRCYPCHGPDENVREAGLRLDTEEAAFAELSEEPGVFAIVPSDRDASVLYQRISAEDPDDIMPPPESNRTLTAREIEIIGRWIEQGAEWKRHWAFIPPVANSAANGIDDFVRRRLRSERLRMSPPADRSTLLRRVTFDLTGLPPTLAELDAFLADGSVDAYEKVVDRLLNDPAYGEKMASHWLDAARYADSHGYQDDMERSMWPWRDWVIHAFNSNLPYDEFGRWQIAGDLIPNGGAEQILATGFNRNHMITQEGGVIEEEYRVAYVSDRVATTATVFLGLTMDCARCHDHKFDPISQRDYYQFYGFFNQVPEQGVIDYQTRAAAPALVLGHADVRESLPFINSEDVGDSLRSMVMADGDSLRVTHVLERGRYDRPTDAVRAGTPAAVLNFGDDRPRNRLGLADWMFDPANPLPARVAVNRMWSMLFGRGIVQTINDFGNQGSIPSHPDLLDWLATMFVSSGWDTKALLRTIVLSDTYRQSSDADAERLSRDPDNVLLSRGPRFRLPAEALRDQVLHASGLLVREIGGPSVKPYQPDGLWAEKTGGGGGALASYVPDQGDKLYRRSLYTFWKRTVPPPTMMMFDAPDRSMTAVHRQTTSTPLQSLVLMNDPQWVESARAMAYRVMRMHDSPETRVESAFRLLTARSPARAARNALVGYLTEELERFAADPEAARRLMAVGEHDHPGDLDMVEAAAYTTVMTALFNLYETVTRN